MNRLPDLLIVVCVMLLILSMSALSQTKGSSSTDPGDRSQEKTELPKIIVRSAAKGSWAAVRFTSERVVFPATRFAFKKVASDGAPKLANIVLRSLALSARTAAHAGKLSLDRLKAKLPQ